MAKIEVEAPALTYKEYTDFKYLYFRIDSYDLLFNEMVVMKWSVPEPYSICNSKCM